MIAFREMINGPPCELRPEGESVFRFNQDDNHTDIESESGLVGWMCNFSHAQETSITTEQLFQNWTGYFQDIGISVFSYYRISPKSEDSSIMTHYGLQDVMETAHLGQEFFEKNALISYAFQKNELLKFSDLQHHKGLTSREKKYVDTFQQFGLSEAYALPVFNSGLYNGFFIFGTGQGYVPFNKRQLSMVIWACQMAHYRFTDLMGNEEKQVSQSEESAKLNRQKRMKFSDNQAANKVIRELKDSNIADQAETKNDSYLYQVAAAHKFGYEQPFSKPQNELNYALVKMTASKEVTEDAWKFYHMLRQMES